MDKREILKLFEAQIAADIAIMTKAALAAHEGATHSESKQEDQYDTRGLEASYLAGAQSKRAKELEDLLALYKTIDIKSFSKDTPIQMTAIVELELDEKTHFYLLMPLGGGRSVSYNGKTIHVITPQAPLGEALVGLKCGNDVTVRIQNVDRDYLIKQVF